MPPPGCAKCGVDIARGVDVVDADGNLVGTGYLCHECMAQALAGAERMRREFEELLAGGMSREDANTEMIRRINAASPT